MPITIEPRPNYKGPLILVQVPGARPGVCVKMTQEEAVARGLMAAPEVKREEPARNKARKTSGNKGQAAG